MARLFACLQHHSELSSCKFVTLNDTDKCFSPQGAERVLLQQVRSKYGSFSVLKAISSVGSALFSVVALMGRLDCRILISTGPGIAIVPALMFRLMGRQVIHVETWSRFNTCSFSGKVMYRLSTKFYVQNKEQLRRYPKAVWSGRL
ncbi:PssD/Cps14F family polysaccharide biosynthesis glycosyltransferase [Bowmanella dokdonensis]